MLDYETLVLQDFIAMEVTLKQPMWLEPLGILRQSFREAARPQQAPVCLPLGPFCLRLLVEEDP